MAPGRPRQRAVLLVAALVCVATIAACSDETRSPSTSTPSATASPGGATALAARYGFTLADREPRVIGKRLPRPSGQAGWVFYYLQHACRDGGFDLRPYAGRQLTFTSYAIVERLRDQRAQLWTIACDGRFVGAYISVRTETPGVYGLRQAAALW